jgi:hypothetical protein
LATHGIPRAAPTPTTSVASSSSTRNGVWPIAPEHVEAMLEAVAEGAVVQFLHQTPMRRFRE